MSEPLQGGESPKVEVTPAMIDAGIRSYLSWDHLEDSPGEIVAEIYSAMAQLAPSASRQTFVPEGGKPS